MFLYFCSNFSLPRPFSGVCFTGSYSSKAWASSQRMFKASAICFLISLLFSIVFNGPSIPFVSHIMSVIWNAAKVLLLSILGAFWKPVSIILVWNLLCWLFTNSMKPPGVIIGSLLGGAAAGAGLVISGLPSFYWDFADLKSFYL